MISNYTEHPFRGTRGRKTYLLTKNAATCDDVCSSFSVHALEIICFSHHSPWSHLSLTGVVHKLPQHQYGNWYVVEIVEWSEERSESYHPERVFWATSENCLSFQTNISLSVRNWDGLARPWQPDHPFRLGSAPFQLISFRTATFCSSVTSRTLFPNTGINLRGMRGR